MILDFLFKKIFLNKEEIEDLKIISEKEIEKSIKKGRNPFSKYLPYFGYHDGIYLNKDGSVGFIFLCNCLWNDSDKARKILESCIKELPEKGTLSFSFISMDYLDPFFFEYLQDKKARNNPLINRCAQFHVDFLKKSTKEGIPVMFGTPLKYFYLVVSARYEVSDQEEAVNSDWIKELRSSLKEQLKGAGLFPTTMDPDLLIKFYFNILNGYWNDKITWNKTKPIASQILNAETEIEFNWNRVKTGDQVWACITPKNLPEQWDSSEIADLTGPKDNSRSDSRQIPGHFIFTVIVHYNPKLHREIEKKAGLFFNQVKGDASQSIIGQLIGEYALEHSEAVSEIEQGKRYYYVIPMLWVRHQDEEKLKIAVQKIKNLFISRGFTPQEERGIINVLFPMQFPLNFRLTPGHINALDRHFVLKAKEAACLLPIEGDITGVGKPVIPYISRKGQFISFDPFYKGSANKNCVVFGTTGGGKSFNMNVLVYALYASDALVRIVDLGYSYQKLCQLFKGDYIDFSVDNPISLNPFTFINSQDKEDIDGSLESIVEILLAMVFARADEKLKKEHRILLYFATRWAWEEFGNEADIDKIYMWLAEFPYWAENIIEDICKDTGEKESCLPDLKKEAQKLAFSLSKWTQKGPFGSWVNGKASLDLRNSEFIVLEMEKIKRIPELLSVISLLTVNAASASLYLSDRSKRKLLLFEECGILLKDNPYLENTIKEAYRRARKYNGATITIFQSPLDLVSLGEGGRVIAGNSAYTFFLPSDQYKAATKESFLGITPEMAQVLSTVSLVKPRYGEMGLKTPWGFGIVRSILPGFLYYLISSDPDDLKKIEEKRREKIKAQGNIQNEDELLAEVLEELGRERDEKLWKNIFEDF